MLKTLRIKNLAIVDNIRVEFDGGLNVITGETGAGKSILAQALGLVLGARADKSMIRAGENQCGVEAILALPDSSPIDSILEEMGIDPCEDGSLIIRRIVSASGAGKNSVNDCPTTAQALKRIGHLLVDMHGPHDHQSLLEEDFQLDILDAFAKLEKQRAKYEETYRALLELQQQRNGLDGDDQAVEQQIDLLSFQVKEIEDARLSVDEEESIEKEHMVAANATRILELARGIGSALIEDDASAFNSMAFVQRCMPELSGLIDEGEEWGKEAAAIAIQIQELSNSINSYAQQIEADPERLQWLDDRMALIRKLKRKYGGDLSNVLDFLAATKSRLKELEMRGERLAELDSAIREAGKAVDKNGEVLRRKREKAAKSLGESISEHLRDLGFQHGKFRVGLSAAPTPRPSGLDIVDFGFAPNVGEPMRPLKAIASSGEISRVMLAVKAVLAKHDRIPVLVFDEIDANVGGEMGNAIGSKLTTVAGNHQVLCITHLPQVAIHGTTHFVVAKHVEEGRTLTTIRKVNDDERAEEVARMLGGKDLTSVTLRHARELLNIPEKEI